MARPTVIDLNPNELRYYPFMIVQKGSNGICNIRGDPSGRICMTYMVEYMFLKKQNI